ncbi:hypothetical protein F5876DRAFT_64264 [Lentinula aff. lateritia]|uniref:Uncharacterized protein n=1 Tax=Lentinula aff. lateritia TaxID=2804960 RepID=A0ACC1U4V5_9AGAR|nr:hypothetical protein F5876DRAFT_64264 [Lentinula aff. lateritia]
MILPKSQIKRSLSAITGEPEIIATPTPTYRTSHFNRGQILIRLISVCLVIMSSLSVCNLIRKYLNASTAFVLARDLLQLPLYLSPVSGLLGVGGMMIYDNANLVEVRALDTQY